jgi:hypothetical protein
MKYIYAAFTGIAFTTPSFAQNITAEAGCRRWVYTLRPSMT